MPWCGSSIVANDVDVGFFVTYFDGAVGLVFRKEGADSFELYLNVVI